MKRAKETRIITESDWVVIIRRQRAGRGWCAVCRSEVDIVDLETATVVNQTARTSTGPQPEQHLHYVTAADGSSAVCLVSLERSVVGFDQAPYKQLEDKP